MPLRMKGNVSQFGTFSFHPSITAATARASVTNNTTPKGISMLVIEFSSTLESAETQHIYARNHVTSEPHMTAKAVVSTRII
jgi:hypothetical protein